MRRFTGILLAIAVFFSSICLSSVYAAEKDMEIAVDSRAEALTELGIIKSYTPEADVPKEMVDKVLTSITGNNVLSKKFFGDQYKNEVIKVGQLIPIMIDLAGYTDYVAASRGEYNQTNCRIVAQRIGMLKGVSAGNNEKLRMDVFVKILSNTLFEVDVMRQTVFSEDGKYETQKGRKTINEVCGIVWVEGTLKGMGKINLTTMSELDDDRIRIENAQYTYKKVDDPEQYIGRYVRAYMDEDEPDTVLALEIMDKENSVFKLESEDLISSKITATQFAYSDEKGRDKTLKLSDAVNVVYNGEFVPFYSRDDLLAEDAYFTLIDVGCDEIYDTVIIDKYTPIMVSSASNGKISYNIVSMDNDTYDFDDFFEEGYPFVEANGKAAQWRDVTQYDILSVRQSKTGVYNRMIHSIKKVNGVFSQSREEMKYITVDGKEYKTTTELQKNTVMLNRVKLGDEVSVFFDAFDRAVGIISYGNKNQYAAIMGIASSGMEYKIKYLAEDGKVYVKSISERIRINGEKINPDEAFGSKSTLFYENGVLKEQLIRIRVDGSDEINSITLANSAVENGTIGYDDFTLNYDSGDKDVSMVTTNGTKVLQSRYIVDALTKTFKVCTDDDSLCEVRPAMPYESFKGSLYNIDTDYHVGYGLAKYSTASKLNRYWVLVNATAYVVDHVGTILHPFKEGETATCVYAWSGNTLNELICEDPDYTANTNLYNCMAWASENIRANHNGVADDTPLKAEIVNQWLTTKWKDLPTGAVISVNQSHGLVTNFVVQYLPPADGGLSTEERVFEGIENNMTNGSWVIGRWEYGLDKDNINGETIIANGVVQKVNRFGVVLNCHIPLLNEGEFPVAAWNRSLPISSDASVYVVDSSDSRQRVRIGSFSDIRVGDSLIYRKSESNTNFLMIYR